MAPARQIRQVCYTHKLKIWNTMFRRTMLLTQFPCRQPTRFEDVGKGHVQRKHISGGDASTPRCNRYVESMCILLQRKALKHQKRCQQLHLGMFKIMWCNMCTITFCCQKCKLFVFCRKSTTTYKKKSCDDSPWNRRSVTYSCHPWTKEPSAHGYKNGRMNCRDKWLK